MKKNTFVLCTLLLCIFHLLSIPSFGRVICDTACHAPEGFYAEQEQTLKQAVSRQPSAIRPLRRKWWYAAAACALLLIAAYPVMQLVNYLPSDLSFGEGQGEVVYSQSSSASDDWSDFADADIFMDNMNW